MQLTPLDSKFWKRFTNKYWERKSFVLKRIDSELLSLDAAEVFRLLVLAAEQSRKNRSPLGFKFFVDGIRSSDVETMHVLPKRSDKSLLGYHERIERVYQDYCLVCDELLQVNQDKQAILNRFTHELYKHVGFPNRFVEMGLYLGNYRKTPFGVHVDQCGVFSFPVVGTKKFRVWKYQYAKKHPGLEQSFSYAKHKSASDLLVAKVGDMAYWPSSEWHIAESDGSFSATWSLGVWVDRPAQADIIESIAELLSEKVGKSILSPTLRSKSLYDRNGNISKLPSMLDSSVSALKSLSRSDLELSLKKRWMKRLSSHGMKTLPKSNNRSKLPSILKLRDPNSPIVWSFINSSRFAFSFSGSEPQESSSKSLLKIIKDLNSGHSCDVRKYIGRRSKSDLKRLNELAKSGAFALVKS